MARDYAKSRSRRKSESSPRARSSRMSIARMSIGLLWLFIGVMVGLLIPSFGFIKDHITGVVQGKKQTRKNELLRDPLPSKIKSTQTPEEGREISTKTSREAPNPEEDDKIDFDFYTILPDSTTSKPPTTKNIENAEQKLLKQAELAPKKAPSEDEVTLPAPQIKTPPAETVPSQKPVAAQKPVPATAPKPTNTATKPSAAYILQLGSFKTFEEADHLKAQLSFAGLQAKIKQTTVNGITRQRVWVGVYTSLEAAEKAQQKLAAQNIKSALAQVK
jgi:cell division protein FtsN